MTRPARKTFAKIVTQRHPDADAAPFTPERVALPDARDQAIASALAALVGKGGGLFGKSDGEWRYLDEHKRGAYIGCLRRSETASLPGLFANMFRNDATYGVVSPSYADLDQAAVKDQILLDLDSCFEFTRLDSVLPLLFEPGWGNPFGLLIQGRVLSPDSPRHYYFAEKLAALAADAPRRRILEIGGGYGGLALMLRRLQPDTPYVIVDLFETCLLQYYFLSKAGLNVALVLNPDEQPESGAIALVPTDVAEAFLARFTDVGIVFNSRSFSEMSRETVEQYFALIQDRLRPAHIYHENSNFLLFPDSVRHVEVLASDFPVDPHRYELARLNISPFLGGSGRYREFLYHCRALARP